MRRPLLLLLLPLFLAALAGCGGSGDEGEVRKSVEGLYVGFAERDSSKVCASLTKAQQEKVRRGAARKGQRPQSCEQVMGFALAFVGDALKDAGKAEVTKVEVKGENATASVKFKGKTGKLGLAKEADAWKVSDFDLNRL